MEISSARELQGAHPHLRDQCARTASPDSPTCTTVSTSILFPERAANLSGKSDAGSEIDLSVSLGPSQGHSGRTVSSLDGVTAAKQTFRDASLSGESDHTPLRTINGEPDDTYPNGSEADTPSAALGIPSIKTSDSDCPHLGSPPTSAQVPGSAWQRRVPSGDEELLDKDCLMFRQTILNLQEEVFRLADDDPDSSHRDFLLSMGWTILELWRRPSALDSRAVITRGDEAVRRVLSSGSDVLARPSSQQSIETALRHPMLRLSPWDAETWGQTGGEPTSEREAEAQRRWAVVGYMKCVRERPRDWEGESGE